MKAGEALIVSRRTLDVETTPVLGQWFCTGRSDHESISRASLFLQDGKLHLNEPINRDMSDFGPVQFDFQNLGRTALINVGVTIRLKYGGEKEHQEFIRLGNIGVDKEAHVAIYMPWEEPGRPDIGWSNEATTGRGPLEFDCVPDIRVEVSLVEGQPEKRAWKIQLIGLPERQEPVASAGSGAAKKSANVVVEDPASE